LGQRLLLATQPASYFETSLSLASADYLADHQIYQQAIVPATAYIEMGLAAGRTALKQTKLRLISVSIQQPLALAPGQSTPVQVVLSVEKADSSGSLAYGFEVFSLKSVSAEESEPLWTRHAAGQVAPLSDPETIPASVDLQTLQAAYPDAICVETYYRNLEQRGMAYGSSFQGIQALWRGPQGALGRVQLPPTLQADEAHYCIHPALLDACWQVLGAVVNDGQKEAYLPTAVDEIQLFGPVPSQVWSQVTLYPAERPKQRQISADLMLWNDAGEAVATVQGLILKQVPQRVLQRVLRPDFEDWLYRLDWQPLAPAVEFSTSSDKANRWLVFSDQSGLGDVLIAQFTKTGDQAIRVSPGKTYRQRSSTEFKLDATQPEQFQRLIESLSNGGLPTGIVYLWGADMAPDLTIEKVEQAQAVACGSLLHLVQAVVRTQPTSLPRLWIVTRGTQAIAESSAPLQPQYGSLWGLGRVIATEHPDLHCTCLDLEGAITQPDLALEATLLAAELRVGEAHPQLAYRHQQRYAARLVRYRAAPLQASTDLVIPEQPFQLRIRDYGLLENLQLVPLQRQPPGPNEVEIAVRAVGLNFRDVLNALGMLKDFTEQMGITDTAELPFGGECAGVVTAIGTEVSHLRVGDAVIAAQALGSLASHVTVPAAFVVPKPAAMSFEAAATIPTTFLTAYYGLHHLAKLKTGERVLIHAASGGVGQAAVQIARWLGAEVWGSASEPKWAALKQMGVSQVFNSRNLDFAEQIPALTKGKGVDVILNSLNGDFIPASLSVLSRSGRFVEIGKLGIWNAEQVAEVRPQATYLPFDLLELSLTTPELVTALLQQVMARFAEGQFTPLPHKVFPIQQGVEAFRHMAQAKHIGKVVISLPTMAAKTNGHGTNGIGARSVDGFKVNSQGTYLITGGLGALGLQVAQWLGQQGAKQIVLTGRRSPSAAAQRLIDQLQQTGIAVAVSATDISQPAAVAELIAQIQTTLPPLKGIFHAAGMVDDSMVMGQTWERFTAVMAPKVAGTWLLHQHTQGLELDCFVCFSSVAALVGSPGQANYAAANAFMDALASYRQSLGLKTLSINWGPWSQSGMAAALQSREQARWASQGVSLIEPQPGLSILGQLLETATTAQVAVLPVDWSRYLAQVPPGLNLSFLEQIATVNEADTQPPKLRLELQQTPPSKRRALLTRQLQDLLAKVLGLSANQVNPQQGFADLGMDSLMAVEMRNRLQTEMGCAVPTTLAFDYPTVDALVGYLLATLELETVPIETTGLVHSREPVVGTSSDGPEHLPESDSANNLDGLSQDELADLLAQELMAIKEGNAR
jgi:myxalamid-type polyketide synthase MxaB